MISLTSPVKTPAHAWPAGAKLLALCCATFGLFALDTVIAQCVAFAIVLGLYALPGPVFLKQGLGLLRLLWPFVALVAVWHLWIGAPAKGTVILLRMLSAVGLANLVTLTTRLSDMMDVVHWLTRPLQRFGLNPRVIELAVALVVRLTPVLAAKGTTLSEAWRARARQKAGWRLLLPFTVLALDDADHVADALRARGGFEDNRKD